MKHCGTNELDLWRVFLGRSENRESISQALNGSLLVNKTKAEVQCHPWLWNLSQGCFPFCPHPLTPLECGDWTSECSKESSLVACTFSSAVI